MALLAVILEQFRSIPFSEPRILGTCAAIKLLLLRKLFGDLLLSKLFYSLTLLLSGL